MRGSGISRLFSVFSAAAHTDIYALSLHDALPISQRAKASAGGDSPDIDGPDMMGNSIKCIEREERIGGRSEEHTSELQSLRHLVCRLLLEKKKQNYLSNQPAPTAPTPHAHAPYPH